MKSLSHAHFPFLHIAMTFLEVSKPEGPLSAQCTRCLQILRYASLVFHPLCRHTSCTCDRFSVFGNVIQYGPVGPGAYQHAMQALSDGNHCHPSTNCS